ncbi:hypothetical protein GIB67_023823 [Kingdonia uniflora]|uniref:Pentatricopeptide repeat-containing protein n=1 Tax=Kingdonia uniflora TaxID=39325 RepID=A0A7J7NGC9_9MAGN|nr:hypothetical protein GIB67_023823 [Kingdonia uniflora]
MGFVYDVVTGSALVGCVQNDQLLDSFELFKEMQQEGVEKQSEEAQKFFSRMLDMGQAPNNFTYATVLDTCEI